MQHDLFLDFENTRSIQVAVNDQGYEIYSFGKNFFVFKLLELRVHIFIWHSSFGRINTQFVPLFEFYNHFMYVINVLYFIIL